MKTGAHFGPPSRWGCIQRPLSRRPGCHGWWGPVGFGKLVACRHHILLRPRPRSRVATRPSRNVSTSDFCMRRNRGCARSPANWGGRPRRSRASYDAMRRRGVGASSIGRPLPSGTRTARRSARSRRNWRPMRRFGTMCRIGWPVSSRRRPARRCAVRRSAGRDADAAAGNIGAGAARGARRRSRTASYATFRTTAPCASALKPSTKRGTYKGAGRSDRS